MLNRRTLALAAAFAFGMTGNALAQETYIPLVSKGFQHQFWQAVKQGAEQAGVLLRFEPALGFEGIAQAH